VSSDVKTAEPEGQVTVRGTLVAGIGNIFFGDDGFGSEVARSLDRTRVPEGVRVVDYGIRGTHLAYDLLEGWESLVLIDTVPARGCPGRVHVLSVDADQVGSANFDPHGMDPASVLASLESLGGSLPPTWVVGCEPAVLDEVMGLSPHVAAAVPVAVATVSHLVSSPPLRRGRAQAKRS
jgi:hydrogenase maturation protease